jgi:hypothetical protein
MWGAGLGGGREKGRAWVREREKAQLRVWCVCACVYGGRTHELWGRTHELCIAHLRAKSQILNPKPETGCVGANPRTLYRLIDNSTPARLSGEGFGQRYQCS